MLHLRLFESYKFEKGGSSLGHGREGVIYLLKGDTTKVIKEFTDLSYSDIDNRLERLEKGIKINSKQ